MVALSDIHSVSGRIAAEFRPERVVLFGSYARGTPTDASDVDMLVVLAFEGSSVRKAAEIRASVEAPFALDIVVRTPEQLSERVALGDSFLREVLEEGQTLYESAHA